MRFHGMVGDHVTISPSAKAWRPPDYITSPTRHVMSRPEHHPNPTQQDPPSSPPSPPSPRNQPPRTKKKNSYPQFRIKPLYKYLPIPITCVNPSRHRRPCLTIPQRLLALMVALFVAFGILVALSARFSNKLDQITATVEAQQRLLADRPSSNLPSPIISRNNTKHLRRVLAFEGNAAPHGVQALLPTDIIVKAFSALLTSAQTIHGIMTMLFERQHLALMPTASILLNTPSLLTSPNTSPSQSPISNNDLENRLRSLHGELLDMYRQIFFKNEAGPAQSPTSTPASNALHSKVNNAKKNSQQMNSAANIHADLINELGKQIGSPEPRHLSNVLYPHALNVVGSVPLKTEPLQKDASPKPSPGNPGKTGEFAVPRIRQTYPRPDFKYTKGPAFPQAIYYWQLPGGKSLCRIFNVGYLSDGRVLVPKWMKKYSQFLVTRCGAKDLIFATENMSGSGSVTLDSHALKAHGVSKHKIDPSNEDRDLIGTYVPRDHMPHFVSDIFFHLVVCELLLGSGRHSLRAEFLFPPRVSDVESASSSSKVQDLKPSMFLSDETWNRPHSEWVPRLAQFFRHPRLGFTFLRWNGSKKTNNGSGSEQIIVSSFRSLVISNLQSHEPYGMFGANGTNIVLDANGVTRAPTWKRKSPGGGPCRLTVTVLTRKGPRALLRLSEFQQRLNYLWKKEASMLIDFKVVDFTEKSFDYQVKIMQETNVLIATHGAGNANFIFLRPSATVIEVFPFAYKAGPFDRFAAIFGLDYKAAMSTPQTDVFKECMNRHETNQRIKKLVFSWWDKAVGEEKLHPWVHRLELEKEIGEPGKSEGMTTRGCVRLQELEFDIDAVSRMVFASGKAQCAGPPANMLQKQQPFKFSVQDSRKGDIRPS